MVAYIDANEKASNDLLEKLVNINSGTHNLEGVREVGEIMIAQLSDLGFNVKWIPMDSVQRAGVLGAGALVLSCLLSGCGPDPSEAPPTPESTQSAVDAVKKLQQGAVPTPGGMKPPSEVKTKPAKK